MARGTNHNESEPAGWSNTQMGLAVAAALVFGMVLGYGFFASMPAQPAATAVPAPVAEEKPSPAVQPAAVTAPAPAPSETAQLEALSRPLLEAAQQNPNDPAPYIQLGNIYSDHKQFAQAVEYYTKALALRPKDVNVRTDLGTAYWYMGETQKAIAEYEKSLKVDPRHPQTLFNLGLLRWKALNDREGAMAAWQTLLDTNPSFPQRAQVEAMLRHARSGGKETMAP